MESINGKVEGMKREVLLHKVRTSYHDRIEQSIISIGINEVNQYTLTFTSLSVLLRKERKRIKFYEKSYKIYVILYRH